MRNRLATQLAAVALAIGASGCAAPWPGTGDALFRKSTANSDGGLTTPESSRSRVGGTRAGSPASPEIATQTASSVPSELNLEPTRLPVPLASPPQTASSDEMAAAMDKIAQVGQMDPEAQAKLLEQLQHTDAKFWPAVAEQFRASLAYHQELVAKKKLRAADTQRTDALRRENDALALVSNAPMPPSTPIGALGDPRRADADGLSSEELAKAMPYSQLLPDEVGAHVQTEMQPPGERIAGERVATQAVHVASPPMTLANGSRETQRVLAASYEAVGDRPEQRAARNAEEPVPTAEDKNWQQLVVAAADDLSRRVAESPSTTAEVHQHVSLRMLRLLTGQTELALEPIPHISPVEQDYWSRQLFALATYLDHHSQPDDKRRAAASAIHLDEALGHLRELGILSLRNLTFCKEVHGYGAVEPYDTQLFSSGQQVSLYVEVENYDSHSTDKGFTTSLGSTYEILDSEGRRIDGGEFPDVEDCCRNRRRDFHIQFGLALPESISPGRYQLQLVVKDRHSGKIAHAKAGFEVAAK